MKAEAPIQEADDETCESTAREPYPPPVPCDHSPRPPPRIPPFFWSPTGPRSLTPTSPTSCAVHPRVPLNAQGGCQVYGADRMRQSTGTRIIIVITINIIVINLIIIINTIIITIVTIII